MATRLYVVNDRIDKYNNFLVDANSSYAAIAYVARKRYKAHAAKPKDVGVLMNRGVKIEDASKEEETEDAED